jgi:hypothetical protein
MKKEYEKHIISTPEHQVWLHKTHSSNIESILKQGLYFGAGDLSSTATIQPREQKNAENSYQQTHKGSNAVIVIKIPKKIANKYYWIEDDKKGPGHSGYETDRETTYFDRGFYIQRQHIHGWIDKETNEYHENPYLSEPQKLTSKHFPEQIYGGLEKDLVKEKQTTKKQKTPKNNREKLPLPPKEIHIVE